MSSRTFTPFPTLITERLTLRQLSIHDAQDIFALRSDPDINKYLGRVPSKSVEEALNFIHIITENIRKNESVYWVITLTDSNTFAGTICLFEFSDEHGQCEIGYELLSAFQGKGIMQEAAKKVIEYAIQTLKVQTIEAFTHQNNLESIKLLEKLEFKKAGEVDGEYCVYKV
ncbi:MAG: GNAT family N-acetyltransferase [Bacteroidota bacterium]